MITKEHLLKQLDLRKETQRVKTQIGVRLKHQRKKFNMTLQEASDGICSVSYLSKVENSLIDPSPKFVEDLYSRYNLSDKIYNEDFEQELDMIFDKIFNNLDYTIPVELKTGESHQYKLLEFYDNIDNLGESKIDAAHEKIKTYIKNFTNLELAMYFLSVIKAYYVLGRHKQALDIIEICKKITFTSPKVKVIISYYELIHMCACKSIHVEVEMAKLESALLEYSNFKMLGRLMYKYLDYLANYESISSFQIKTSKVLSLTEDQKNYLYAKNYYVNHEFESALKFIDKACITEETNILRCHIYYSLNHKGKLVKHFMTYNQYIQLKNKIIYKYYYHISIKIKSSITPLFKELISSNFHSITDYQFLKFICYKAVLHYEKLSYYKDASSFQTKIIKELL